MLIPRDHDDPEYATLVDAAARGLAEAEQRPTPELQVWRDLRASPEWTAVGPADLAGVRPHQIETYLRDTGWVLADRDTDGAVWGDGGDDRGHAVRVPSNTLARDYRDCVRDLLATVATVEARPTPQQQVLADLDTLATPVPPAVPLPDPQPEGSSPGESAPPPAAAAETAEAAAPTVEPAPPSVFDTPSDAELTPEPGDRRDSVAEGSDRRAAAPQRFRPASQADLAPSGEVARLRANLAAIRALRAIQAAGRPASTQEQGVLARWSGWGAVARVFDDRHERFDWARAELAELLSESEVRAAARNTLNAHYTDLALVQRIWQAVRDLGFTGGRVLEPGCGSGNFLGQAPDDAHLVGVEVEPTSAAIAQQLYPDAQILAESFADTRVPDGSFDLAIGNVPFGDVRLTDRTHNPAGHAIHNHFILKALRLTKPGGLVVVLTSRYTLDARVPGARREMASLADLLGAVRLPSGAHRRAAGTDAITDLLVLRRREPGRRPADLDWEQAPRTDINGAQITINQYFLDHPDRVLGRLTSHENRGMYRADDLVVDHPNLDTLPNQLAAALNAIVEHARIHDLLANPTEAGPAEPVALVSAHSARPEGSIRANGDGFVRLEQGIEAPFHVPHRQSAELRALLGIRDTVVELLNTEAATRDHTPRIDQFRATLNTRYDAYLARYGPINRFTWRRTGRIDPETGEEKHARVTAKLGGFRLDPHAPTVLALEQFDGATQTATKTDIFTQRVVAPRQPRLEADSPADAMAICLDTHGELRIDEIARLLGTNAIEARHQLGTLVFDDPDSGLLVTAADYLSGNVRAKLRIARAAAEDDSRYDVNVAALAEVIPPPLKPEEIHAALGAAWIGATDVQAFLRETLQDPSLVVEHPGGTVWGVDGDKFGVQATQVWGTEDMPAPVIAQHLLEQRTILVYDSIKDLDGSTKRVLNADKTAEAQAKADALNERFGEWVWDDPARATRLADVYNDRFNSLVLRSYDDAELSLPGLALTFQPRPHQVAAVARMIAEPAVLLAHEVGAGKTAEMAMGCMELRRLGLVTKPVIVVPNNMLEQFGREFAAIYPQAKLLIATKDDFARDRRREFISRCATGDWDAVIMTKTAFERIPMSPQAQQAYLDKEVKQLRQVLDNAKNSDNRLTVKRLEGALQRAEERLKRKLDTDKDAGITFEATGLDYIVVDEAHLFKNLRTVSNIAGAAIDGSSRASDLDMKLDYLRERHGGRVGTFATATPIANSITEAHVMQRYLRPDLLRAAGVEVFDAWAGTFGQQVTAIEVSPDGGRFRMKTRFAKFTNVPELVRMFHIVADVKTADDLNLPVPDLAPRPGDGNRTPEVVRVPASPQIQEFIALLGHRADKISQRDPVIIPKVDGGVCEDSMLLVSGHGRNAALDMRLLPEAILHDLTDPPADEPHDAADKLRAFWDQHRDPTTRTVVLPREREHELWDEYWADTYGTALTKLPAAADRIATRWMQHRDDVYPLGDGTDHPQRGSLQIVFSDLGTPNPEKWNVYHALRDLLVARGMPRDQVRFVHDATNDQAKGQLFEDCRSGKVAVLIGSTEKMGVGTNVQTRAIALHHLDCPWRPADVQQREGRIVRQRNLNPEVEILRYITEESFDAYSWQTVARKAEAIAQVMRGKLDVREIEDIGDNTLSYTEAKAIATGNPLVLKHAEAKAELTRLQRLHRAHDRGQDRFDYTIRQAEKSEPRLLASREALAALIEQRRDTRGDKFAITLNGKRYAKRADAAEAFTSWLKPLLATTRHRRDVGRFGGLGDVPLSLTLQPLLRDTAEATIAIGHDSTVVTITDKDLRGSKPVALIVKLENGLERVDRTHQHIVEQIDTLRTEVEHAREQLGKPFPHADALATAQTEVAAIEKALEARATEDEKQRDTVNPVSAASPVAAGVTAPSRSLDTNGQRASASQATRAPAAAPPADPAPSIASESRAQSPGRRTLRFTYDGGVVLFGTEKGDGTSEILRNLSSGGHRHINWKWSRRIDTGTATPGAWYIPGTRGRTGTTETLSRIDASVRALRQAGYPVDVDIDPATLDSSARLHLASHLVGRSGTTDRQVASCRSRSAALLDRVMSTPPDPSSPPESVYAPPTRETTDVGIDP